jgi:leucyl-tRNA synthetase
LKEDAEWCSNAINKILQHHVRFASLIAQRIENASKSQYNLKHDDSETTKITNDIREVSHSLSINVTDMEYDLESFVSALEDVQVVVKERSLADKLREWLKYLLKVIAGIVAAVCFLISTCLSCVEPKPQYLTSAVSTLGKAAAKVYRVDSGAFSEYIILPLQGLK